MLVLFLLEIWSIFYMIDIYIYIYIYIIIIIIIIGIEEKEKKKKIKRKQHSLKIRNGPSYFIVIRLIDMCYSFFTHTDTHTLLLKIIKPA